MPMYDIQDIETGDVDTVMCSYDKLKEVLAENPNLKQIYTKAPGVIHGTGDRTKPPKGFMDVLSRISEANPTSALADDLGKKDPKSVKIREANKRVKSKIGDLFKT